MTSLVGSRGDVIDCGVELHIKLSRVSASLCTQIPR